MLDLVEKTMGPCKQALADAVKAQHDLKVEEDLRTKDVSTIGAVQGELTSERQAHERECQQTSDLRTQLNKAQERCGRIEGDIGKLREEFGAKEVKRVLDGGD